MSTTTETISDCGHWDDAMDMNISDQELMDAYNIMMEKGEDENENNNTSENKDIEKNNTSEHVENKDIEMMTFDMLMDDVECL